MQQFFIDVFTTRHYTARVTADSYEEAIEEISSNPKFTNYALNDEEFLEDEPFVLRTATEVNEEQEE